MARIKSLKQQAAGLSFSLFSSKCTKIQSPIPIWLCLECQNQNTTGITEFFFFSHLVASSHEIFPKTGFIAFVGLPPTQVYNNKKHISNFQTIRGHNGYSYSSQKLLGCCCRHRHGTGTQQDIISVVSVLFLFPIIA